MAYSLTDQFRGLRTTLRLSGVVLGLGGGAMLLFLPPSQLQAAGVAVAGALWPIRLAGALLISVGSLFLYAASERVISPAAAFTAVITHSLLAIVLLLAYLQREFTELTVGGLAILLAVFLLCLIGAITPLRYLRGGYRNL
ncbi:MAG: hypothetical protein R2911_34025 [Caldilineaceae bacterium]